MAHVLRAEGAQTQTSNGMAASTVAGMVIGALGLFALVLTYQLLPSLHRRRQPNNTIPTPFVPSASRGTTILRIMRRLIARIATFLQPSKSKSVPSEPGSQTHKPLRSLHLPAEQQRRCHAAREKFATKLRLNLYVPPVADILSSRTPRDRVNFARLDDSIYQDAAYHTEKPAPAVMSPWSPREQDYPYSSVPIPSPWLSKGWERNSPPPFSPPPAYVPSTPRRYGFIWGQPDRSPLTGPGTRDTVTVTKHTSEAIDLSEIVVCNPAPETPAEVSQNVFVISDDADALSDSSSISSTWSCGSVVNVL
ncbi:uncharacterized protein FIBRA_01474 [Fibroporia radiculosa]|uniref:Uncharacterized protein n=1 Tax=Fibroporia radiculosa TaxID=599839 RepID=J4I8I2_9APHY|nr:uncharacterized protein FIBRA_01474 [Fibroporia radiculosa]CCL99456.1 predicted protein [Fibroporia radiculosa]